MKVVTLDFDFVDTREAIKFIGRIVGLTGSPCLRRGTRVMVLTLQNEVSQTEDVARVFRGMLVRVKYSRGDRI